MASPSAIATEFVKYYYATFDSASRASLGSLYRPESFMSWEGGEFGGVTKILEKLAGLPEGVTHKIDTLDAQPGSATEPSIIVLVTGQLVIENNPPLQFCQTFHLRPQDGSYYVANDLFRLNVG